MSNVYGKLAKARVMLQKSELKKSGNNKFAGYTYFELGDFLPKINEIFEEIGLCGVVKFDKEIASLTIYDTEGEGTIEFTSPMGAAALKGCHEIQNIGAVETYSRRYLYMSALEIVEHDALDSTTGLGEESKEVKKVLSEAQINRLYAIAKSKGHNKEGVDTLVKKKFGCTVDVMNKKQYDEVVKGYEGL